MKDFENDLIYYPNPDPVKEPRFILKCVDELEKSTKYSVTCNGTCLLYTSMMISAWINGIWTVTSQKVISRDLYHFWLEELPM